jgi:hypothetical protein
VVFLDYQRREQGSLAWTDGLLTEIVFPELDAGTRDSASIRLTITADTITRTAGGGGGYPAAGFGGMRSKAWTLNSFALSISGMSTAPRAAAWIGPITVQQAYVPPVGPGGGGVTPPLASLSVSDLSFSVAEQSASELSDWHDDFVVQGQGSERTGRLEYLDQARAPIFALDFTGLGIRSVAAERLVADRSPSTIARARADLYCEEIALSPPQPVASTGTGSTGSGTTSTTGTPASGGGTTASTASTAPTAPTGSAEDLVVALRAALIGGEVPAIAAARLDPATVASRLIRSADGVEEAAIVGDEQMADGRRVGADWARERATLEELEELSAVAGTEWNALTLPRGHTLVEALQKHGTIPGDQAGDLVLPRDRFVEGVVDGASEVFAEVRPLVRDRLRRT